VLGHRGAPRAAPDNTLEGFRIAARSGADGIECDARLTADGVVVLHHDPVVPGLGALHAIGFATLRQLHPQIPTLDEALGALPDHTFVLNIELKNNPGEPGHDTDRRVALVVADWVDCHELHHRVIVSSFDRPALDVVRGADSRIATGLLMTHGAAVLPALPGVAADGHGWILPHHLGLVLAPHRTIDAAHDRGLEVGTWTLDSPRRSEYLAHAGIDAVITNVPGVIGRRLGSDT
jgi:glycerophosphoryl diester phosphodiesterase